MSGDLADIEVEDNCMRSFLQSTDTRAELISFTGIRSTEYEFTRSVLRISLSCRLR